MTWMGGATAVGGKSVATPPHGRCRRHGPRSAGSGSGGQAESPPVHCGVQQAADPRNDRSVLEARWDRPDPPPRGLYSSHLTAWRKARHDGTTYTAIDRKLPSRTHHRRSPHRRPRRLGLPEAVGRTVGSISTWHWWDRLEEGGAMLVDGSRWREKA